MTKPWAIKPLPCPFCGKKPGSGRGKPGFWYPFVQCNNAECAVRPRVNGDDAVAAWNRRAK